MRLSYYSIVEPAVFLFSKMLHQSHVIRARILLFLLHCSAVPVHTILVYCSAANAAILLHFYTMVLLYPLEYFFSSAGVHSSSSK